MLEKFMMCFVASKIITKVNHSYNSLKINKNIFYIILYIYNIINNINIKKIFCVLLNTIYNGDLQIKAPYFIIIVCG